MIDFLIPLVNIGLTIAVPLVIVGGSTALVSRTEIGRALVDRLRSGRVDSARMEQLAAEIDDLREEMVELQERLDTTELLLQSQRKPPGRIDGVVRDG